MTEAMHDAFKLCTEMKCAHFHLDHGIVGFFLPDPTLRRKPRTRIPLADIPHTDRRINYYAYIVAVSFLVNIVARVRNDDGSFKRSPRYTLLVSRFSGVEMDIIEGIGRRIETLHDFNILYGMEFT